MAELSSAEATEKTGRPSADARLSSHSNNNTPGAGDASADASAGGPPNPQQKKRWSIPRSDRFLSINTNINMLRRGQPKSPLTATAKEYARGVQNLPRSKIPEMSAVDRFRAIVREIILMQKCLRQISCILVAARYRKKISAMPAGTRFRAIVKDIIWMQRSVRLFRSVSPTSLPPTARPGSEDGSCTPRTIVMCFDGTDKMFSDQSTNIVRLFQVLEHESREQLCYYQPGVGTYYQEGVLGGGKVQQWIAKKADLAAAWYLDQHIIHGYRYLTDHWEKGDRICLLGFSRGAYIARGLAGMLHKIGLVLKGNAELTTAAYVLYKRNDNDANSIRDHFRESSRKVTVNFLGAFDTVAGVGYLREKKLPLAEGNSTIHVFRHALSLDERRAKFQPTLYQGTINRLQRGATNDQNQAHLETDVREVWFCGSHGDVGGGQVLNWEPSLADIPLRWMIREIMIANCGVLFNRQKLLKANICPEGRSAPMIVTAWSGQTQVSVNGYDQNAATEKIHDELLSPTARGRVWRVLEYLPGRRDPSYGADPHAVGWRWGNRGKPRRIPDAKPSLHHTVQLRMRDESLRYFPCARMDIDMAEYVP